MADASPPAAPARPSRRPRWWWFAIAAVVGVALVVAVVPAPEPHPPEPELDEPALRALAHDPAVLERGRTLWRDRCVVCHGPAGEGSQGPNLRDDFWLHGSDMTDLVRQIADGAPFARPVAMPSWRAAGLKTAEIRALAAYVASLHGSETGKGKAPEGKESPIAY
jgi:mono/diheme cytochrome c family protein